MASDTEERASPGLVLGAGAIDAAGNDGQALISIVAAGTSAVRWVPGCSIVVAMLLESALRRLSPHA